MSKEIISINIEDSDKFIGHLCDSIDCIDWICETCIIGDDTEANFINALRKWSEKNG